MMGPSFKARVLLAKLQCSRITEDPAFSVLAGVNTILDSLLQPTEERREEQHLLVAEAVALKYPYRFHYSDGFNLDEVFAPRSPYGSRSDEDLVVMDNAKREAQDVLGGAIVLGCLPLVESLLEEGTPTSADANTRSLHFGRPLALAAAWGHLHIVRHLLKSGADAHASSRTYDRADYNGKWTPEEGMTPRDPWRYAFRNPEGSALSAAALGGHKDVVEFLLQPEYCIHPLGLEYSYALAAGAKGGHLDIVHVLVRTLVEATGWTLADLPGTGPTMLWEAARYGRQDVVRMLLDSGVDIDAVPHPVIHGCEGTAIQHAAIAGNAAVVRLLLECGANMAPQTRSVRHTMEAAAPYGHEEVVDVLIEYGADPREAFFEAAAHGQTHLARRLIKRDPTILSMKPAYNDTADYTLGAKALEMAISTMNPAMVSVLVEAGVSLNQPTSGGDLPVDYAKKNSTPWVLEALLSMGAVDTDFDGEYGENWEAVPEWYKEGYVHVTKRTWQWVGKY